jgi:macrolide-specific efflux system membrane fusion protein
MDIPTRERPAPPSPASAEPPGRGWRVLLHRLRGRAEGTLRGWRGLSRRAQLLLGLALILVLTGLLLWRQQSERLAGLVIGTVERGDIEDSVTALGNIQPLNYVDVGAQVSGQLDKLHVDVGDDVKQNDLLAEIDAQVQSARVAADQAQLANVKAQLADKQSQLVLARQQFERQKRLKADNATSTDAYQSAEAAERSAQAQVDALTAQAQQNQSTLQADQVTLGYSKIYAPMAGTIASLIARQGQTLNANQQAPIILQIADLTKMTVWTQVSEADIVRLKPGMEAYFTTLGNPDRRWTGTLRQIQPTPTVTNNVVLYTALFDVDNPKRELMTQMSAQVFFVVAEARNVLTVPMSALRPVQRGGGKAAGQNAQKRAEKRTAQGQEQGQGQRNGKPYRVTVLGPAGTLTETVVRIGVTNRIAAEVISGLEEGDRIVIGKKSAAPRKQGSGNSGSGRPPGMPGGGFGMR